jgi:hypothetical protein
MSATGVTSLLFLYAFFFGPLCPIATNYLVLFSSLFPSSKLSPSPDRSSSLSLFVVASTSAAVSMPLLSLPFAAVAAAAVSLVHNDQQLLFLYASRSPSLLSHGYHLLVCLSLGYDASLYSTTQDCFRNNNF